MVAPTIPGFGASQKWRGNGRIDDYHGHKGWNWVRGHFLAMDKGTIRGMIGAEVFNIEVRTRVRPQIAEFSPGGLDSGSEARLRSHPAQALNDFANRLAQVC